MKKSTMKVLALIMAVIMIVGTLAVVPFSAISNQHVHTKGTFVETVEPTCLLYGYSVYKCAECGEAFLTDVTDKTEQHDWQEVGEVPATCDTPGQTAGRKCTICGTVEGCEEVTVDHVRAYKILDVNDCKEGVWYVEYCKVCGEVLDKLDKVLIGDHEHELKADVKVAPTCAAEGLADIYCENCGFVIEDVVVEKLDENDESVHDWEEITVEATFAENEKTYNKCKVCGKETDAVEAPETSIASKLNYNLADDYAALEYGQSKTYEYTYNGVSGTYTLTKDACQHEFASAGYAYDLPTGVVYSTDYDSADAFIEGYARYLDVADLYELFVCPTCGKTQKVVLIEKVGHIYDEYTFEFLHNVMVTGGAYDLADVLINFEAGYDLVVKKCGEKDKRISLCTFCKYRQVEPTEQVLGDGAEHEYVYVCMECEGNDSYVYNDEEYFICTNCEHLRLRVCLNEDTLSETGYCLAIDGEWANGEHTPSEEEFTMPATCVDLAYKYNKCTVCGAELKIEGSEFGEVDPTNHDWEITEKTKIVTLEAPTCTTPGRRVRYCNRFACTEYIEEALPVDTVNGHDLHAADTGVEFTEATCSKPLTYKYYCDICKKIVYIEDGDVNPEAHGEIITVEAIGITCTANGAYEYKYCADCGAIVEIDGEPVDGLNIDEDLDEVVITADENRFIPEDWDDVYGGDTTIEYEVVRFANNDPMFYRLLSGGCGHAMIFEEGDDPDCFDAGKKDLYYCENCDFVDAENDGAEIPALKHKNAKTQGIKAGDADLVEEVWYEGISDIRAQQIWALRAKETRTYITNDGITKDFLIEQVPATCEKDGYIVGTYCPDCMAKDNEGKAIEEFNIQTNIAGYVIKTDGHSYADIAVVAQNPDAPVCGAENYSYTIRKCDNCGEYVIEGFVPALFEDHEAEVYTEDEAEEDEEIEAGAAKIYTLVLVEGDLVDIEEVDFVECTDTKYEAKRCVNCGEYFDIVEIAPVAHRTADNEVIDITCTGYNKDQVGYVCAICGLEVPDVYVEKAENGLDVILYYNAAGVKVAEVKEDEDIKDYYEFGQRKYFAIEHEWAVPQVDCEALNANIKACAACGINIINEDANGEANVHEYYLRNKEGGDYEFGDDAFIAPFDIDEYDEFAFDDLTLPTPTADGFGTLTCVKCGKVLEVVIPAVEAQAKASFDSAETVLVGDEVTVTVTVSAKDYAFNELTLYVTNIQNVFELVGAEVVYPFAAIDDVKAYINADGDVIIRTPGVANRNVTVTGEDVPFVKLTFKTGDLTAKDEYTVLNYLEILGSDVVRIDDDGEEVEVPEDEQFNVVEGGFGTLTIYNPAFTGNTIGVLAQIYSTEYNQKFDFNRDGAVDLDDYFAMVDFIDSEKSIADFCALIGYDIEAMLDTLDYATYSSGKAWTLNPNTGVAEATQGTDADIANAKEVIKRELKATSYYEIAGEQTIAQFAQSIID